MTVDRGEYQYGTRQFGRGDFLGNDGDDILDPDVSMYLKTKQLGWSHGCPVVDEVIKEYARAYFEAHPKEYRNYKQVMEKGAELALHRYAECNFVYGLIVESARKLNPELYLELVIPTKRQANEPDGEHGQEFVPSSHAEKMSPLSTPIGYALPRVLIEQMGRGENNKERTPERMLQALNIIDSYVQSAQNSSELVMYFAEAAINQDAEPRAVLSHLLPAGILKEENCLSMFQEMIKTMQLLAPKLYKLYTSLLPQQRQELGVADL